MEFTTDDVFAKVRRIIGDEVEPYRWEDEELRENLQLALKRLNVRVPVTRYAGNDIVDYTELPDETDAPIPVDAKHEEGLVYYVVYLCYSKDDPDTANAELANAYLAKAERLMV